MVPTIAIPRPAREVVAALKTRPVTWSDHRWKRPEREVLRHVVNARWRARSNRHGKQLVDRGARASGIAKQGHAGHVAGREQRLDARPAVVDPPAIEHRGIDWAPIGGGELRERIGIRAAGHSIA